MTELLTAAQMHAIEQAAIASGAVTGLELMERAGRGVVEAILDEWPAFQEGSHRAVVLCGPGNNGGDGFVVAWLLKEAGWAVEVFLYGDATKLPPHARVNHERWAVMGEVTPLTAKTWEQNPFPGPCDLVVDALFGTGLTRPIDLPLCALTPTPEVGSTYRIVSIDLPSGLCSDSGRMIGHESESVVAHLTVTFHAKKFGHHLADGPASCGRIAVIDIGLRHDWRLERYALALLYGLPLSGAKLGHVVCSLMDRDGLTARLPKDVDEHKYTHGNALILSGPATRTGAARLAARGALRIGAGLVTVACPPDAAAEHAAQLTAIMLRPVPDAAALTALLDDRRINAVCIGPGLGFGADAAALVVAVLAASDPRGSGSGPARGELDGVALDPAAAPPPPSPPHEGEGGRLSAGLEPTSPHNAPEHGSEKSAPAATSASPPPRGEGLGVGGDATYAGAASATPATPAPNRHVVLDADALTLLARDPALFARLHQNCVLTPHAGEFARLFPDIAARLDAPATTGPAYSKVDATRDAAARAGCTVLFKGPDTVIADPSGACSINSAHYDRAAPWLATAGSGDVLAGFIAGLLARGFAAHDAACTAAWLHVECALSFGPGLIAEDLPEELPKVFRALGV